MIIIVFVFLAILQIVRLFSESLQLIFFKKWSKYVHLFNNGVILLKLTCGADSLNASTRRKSGGHAQTTSEVGENHAHATSLSLSFPRRSLTWLYLRCTLSPNIHNFLGWNKPFVESFFFPVVSVLLKVSTGFSFFFCSFVIKAADVLYVWPFWLQLIKAIYC